jgi:sigma-B regulation protein RsbU (phosphoserine phosphatase)
MEVARAKTVESEHQRGNAEALQLALLPKGLQAPPGCEVATRYWPAERDTLVGGDFYDAFAIDEHRWGLTIGDVCGHGIGAAALTGVVRHTLRSAARYSFSPADMLRSVHVAIAEHDPSMFCTACLIIVMPDASGGAELITTLGGHPHPLLSGAAGVTELGSPGTLLGQLTPEFRVSTAVAAPGDTLVLYTDGLTDLPGDAAVPVDEIRATLSARRDASPDEVADAIHDLKQRRSPDGSRDDTALLVVRFGGS